MTQGHLRQRQQLHLVLRRHPRPTPVLLHQTQGTVDTPLSQSAQRARKPPNHEYCQTAFVPVAHSRRSRSARQTELTRSREVEAALGPPPYPLVCHHPVAPPAKLGSKRKADETEEVASAPDTAASTAGGQPKPKKRRATATMLGPDGQPIELEDIMVIEWLRNTPNAKTRDCISHFTPYLRTDEQKTKFTALIKEVAQLKNGILVLRSAYRGGGAGSKASSPGPIDTK
jgi:transcription initiation factor TFIIF subunit alpha